MKAVSAATMQSLDRQTTELYGVDSLELMERAGHHVAMVVKARFADFRRCSALVLAGKGNNGGDGFVVARLLAVDGWQVSLLTFTGTDAYLGDAKVNFERLPPSVSQYMVSNLAVAEIQSLLQNAGVVVDALFGTGLKSGLSGSYAETALLVNACNSPVVAVDIPSGVDATSGKIPGVAVKADITVTFAAAKTGQLLYPGAEYVGELLVTDIGIPAELLEKVSFVEYVDEEFASALMTSRRKTAHKGSCGHCLIIAGSRGKSGAAAMVANSAMRSGAGLVTLAVPCGIHSVVEMKTTEVMTEPLAETSSGTLAATSLDEVMSLFARRDVAAVGPGLGLHEETKTVVRSIVASASVPLVLDADALNALTGELGILRDSSSPALILTPHPGEMARLAGASIAVIESDRIEAARSFAVANNCYLLLKGARTVIASPDARLAINSSGNPGMASGGMGDVLTGVIAALLGQGYEPFDACCLGVFSHGLAADMAAAEKGELGLIATDVQEMLPYALMRLTKKIQLTKGGLCRV